MAKRRRTARIQRLDQLRALASPVRMEILNSLAGAGPCSIAELGRLLGRAPSSLYHHVSMLVDLGMVRRSGTRAAGANTEQLFETAAEEFGLRHDPSDAERSEAIADAMTTNLRAADRDFRAALCDGTGRVRGRGKDTFGGRFKGWLEEADRAELSAHLEAIVDIFHRRQGATSGRLVAATLVTSPTPVKKQRRER